MKPYIVTHWLASLNSPILFISKLKLENLFRNAEKIDFIFDVT